MARATRSFETDLSELAYQIGRSEAFEKLKADFEAGRQDDQEAQESLMDLLESGRCHFYGDTGPEEWRWTLTERESATLAARLFRDHLEAN